MVLTFNLERAVFDRSDMHWVVLNLSARCKAHRTHQTHALLVKVKPLLKPFDLLFSFVRMDRLQVEGLLQGGLQSDIIFLPPFLQVVIQLIEQLVLMVLTLLFSIKVFTLVLVVLAGPA